MITLTPEARELLSAVRSADGARPADRARLRQRLGPVFAAGAGAAMTLVSAGAAEASSVTGGSAAVVGSGTASAAPAAGTAVSLVAAKTGLIHVLLWTALGAGSGSLFVAGTQWAVTHVQAEGSRAPVVAAGVATMAAGASGGPRNFAIGSVRSVVAAPAPTRATPTTQGPSAGGGQPTAEEGRSSKQSSPRAPAGTDLPKPREDSRLAAETHLLQSAQQALRAGRNTEALQYLDEHAASYGDGLLQAERQATRVLALCRLGRVEEARQQARRLVQVAPNSPVLPTVLGSCAFSEVD